jgi:7-carboxy-7-deazaguanine synthase
MGVGRLVLTGGEPLLQQRNLCGFVAQLPEAISTIEVETNGTIVPLPELTKYVTRFNVSPKLANSDISFQKRIRPDAIRALHQTGKASFKFVAASPKDIEEIAELLDGLDLFGADIWVMPEGTTTELVLERMRTLAPFVLERGWNLTSRLQILLWGARRGM